MKIKEYIEQSARTDTDLGARNELHWLLGAKNEFGELLGPLKKAVVKNVLPDKEKLSDEAGDVAWYIAKGARASNFQMPDTYVYVDANNLLDLITQFDHYWENKDIMGLFCVMLDFCQMHDLNIREVLQKNIDKLNVRHPNGFDIDNPKYTKEEIDAIGNK